MNKTFLMVVSVMALSVSSSWADKGKAVLQGTKTGVPVQGTAMLEDTAQGLKIDLKITQAPAGEHAFHIHEFGSCDDEAKAAGSHYNPANHPHGNTIKDGVGKAHAGDFGSIKVDAKGQGALQATIPGLALSRGEMTVAGRAFVLHEKVDDFSQPTGNAGGRIGCGAIVITDK
jgi:superoxide dismutase, Cu-Zn family